MGKHTNSLELWDKNGTCFSNAKWDKERDNVKVALILSLVHPSVAQKHHNSVSCRVLEANLLGIGVNAQSLAV